jgi:hypothetical protein
MFDIGKELTPTRKRSLKGFALFGIGVGMYYSLIKMTRTLYLKNHPTLENTLITLKLDPRINNYCGRNYHIKDLKLVSEDTSHITYRLNVKGIRGDCKVLAKYEKNSHSYLKSLHKEQIKYSKLSREQKDKSPFTPVNFNDYLIPAEQTINTMNELLESPVKDSLTSMQPPLLKNPFNFKVYQERFSKIFNFNKEHYITGYFLNPESDENKKWNRNINPNDRFYRLVTMIMVANEGNYVFNIRPIGPKYRDYDTEDTFYNTKTYLDIIKKYYDLRFVYDNALQGEQSAEEFRNELIQQKQTSFQRRLQIRKYVILGNGLLFIIGLTAMRYFSTHNINVTTLKSLREKVISSSSLSNFTKPRLICISYKFSPFTRIYKINGLVMAQNNYIKLSANSVVNDAAGYRDLKFYKMEDTNNKSDNLAL